MVVARKTSVGTRGKYAEGKVKEQLEKLALQSGFAYYRPPDARAGSKKTAPADFICLLNTGPYTDTILLEVKEVGHDYRLPKKNFPQEQRARMRKWALAGADCWVIVLHTTTGQWRCLPLSYFDNDFEDKGSWDFSGLTSFSKPTAVMEGIF